MRWLNYSVLGAGTGRCFDIIALNRQILYEYTGTVSVGAKAPQDDDNPAPPSSGWIVKGKLTVQRQTDETIAAALSIDEITLNNSGDKFQQNKEMYPPYKPFSIKLNKDRTIEHLVFKEGDPTWSTNFKRAVASIFQIQGDETGAFVVDESGIHGRCPVEYFVLNKTNSLSIRKTPELKSCSPYSEAIHQTRSNVPPNLCEFDFQKNVIVGNEALYGLMKNSENNYYINVAHVKGTVLIHTFESTGEAQYINSELFLNYLNESTIDNLIDIDTGMSPTQSLLELQPVASDDPTGGRHPLLQEVLITNCAQLLNSLAEGLESSDLKFNEPYDSTVSNIIKLMSQMDFNSLKKLYLEVDIGTSYRQETIRNIFFEIVPRIGTKASVILTKDLVVNKEVKPTTAVQLLISLPFHIYELSEELIIECEHFLTLGPDRPDVRQAAVLSYATLIYNTFVAGKIKKDFFEKYVQKYFNLYLGGYDYEQKMLFLQGLSNLQLGNVANYLDPIIKDENEDNNIKFLAAWITMPIAHTRPEKIYEIYWPIFESKNSTLEMRVAALTLLLTSNPTPARLISLHRIILHETCPHLINYYRSTVKSISETTYPCYQHLRRMLSYIYRHLPQPPDPRYWVTGNYIFDYRDSKFGIGAMLQVFMVGDPISDLPVIAYFKFDTEALGKFTGQLALYIKARGLPDAVLYRLMKLKNSQIDITNLANILASMKTPNISYTPLHLEFIAQMEGKTVLSYYLDQKTFHNLTYGDLISRVNFLIRADSHINMQTVRWPFMNEYTVPTVLGTPSGIHLQTTVLTSLRGNITQQMFTDTITRSNQIDVRYSSYASCKSRSYNPFLNLEHEINREQGFLIYIPVNNEFSVNITTKCVKFSLSRPENLTSGLSFKSRSITSAKGFITRSAVQPYENVISLETKHENFQILKYNINDIGETISINTNLNELNNYRVMLLKSEFMENGFSSSMVVNTLMYLFGVAQLSSIHIGNDRNFTILVNNNELTKIEGSLSTEPVDGPGDKTGYKIDFSLIHKNSIPDLSLHKWSLGFNFLSSNKMNWYKLTGVIKRYSKEENNDWKACLDVTFAPLVFMRKPHTLTSTLIFGVDSSDTRCPINASKIEMSATAGLSAKAEDYFKKTKSTDQDLCPKVILKLSPPPTYKFCKRKNFENITAITNYNIHLKFDNLPHWMDTWTNRLNHFAYAFSDKEDHQLNLNKEIDMAIRAPINELKLEIEINGINWNIHHIPFIPKIDAKYDTTEQLLVETGIKRSCALIHDVINTYDDVIVLVKDFVNKNSSNCSLLLTAECSDKPKLAVFLRPLDNNGHSAYELEIYIGQNHLKFNPNQQETNKILITVNNQETINTLGKSYQYPPMEKVYDFRIEVNDLQIMVVESKLISSTIQFDLNDILSVEIFGVYKNKMCGLCSFPRNPLPNYSFCPP